jgi:putative nucleotidyltransferase with HDIG domain
MDHVQPDVGSPLAALVGGITAAAAVAIALTLPATLHTAAAQPTATASFLLLSVALQFFAVEVYGSGRIGVAAIGILASGFILGPGPAMLIAATAAIANLIHNRGRLHRGMFDAGQFALSAGASAVVFRTLAGGRPWELGLAASVIAGILFTALNHGFLCLAIGLTDNLPAKRVWRERFSWARYHLLSFGPLAFAMALGYDAIGLPGVIAFTLPPALMVLSFRQYVDHTRHALDEVKRANVALEQANAALAVRNADLGELFEFTSGIAARATSRFDLVRYVEDTLTRLAGVTVRVGDASAAGIRLGAAGTLEIRGSEVDERWLRLRDVLVPQVTSALSSLELIERVQRTHLATIAALSRSMEAKDGYTGGHTERVAEIAVALARRLGFTAAELEEIHIGALMHDIGKIGIPERILHKPGPLDDEEWVVMKKHPLISDYILSEVDLAPAVRQIVRSSHERIDGAGYPDRLAGGEIPLPARVVFVADALDALTSARPYRPARPLHQALGEIRANAGTQFCPTVVAALDRLTREEPGLLQTAPVRALNVA